MLIDSGNGECGNAYVSLVCAAVHLLDATPVLCAWAALLAVRTRVDDPELPVVNFYGIACEYGWRRIERRFLPKSVWVETLYEIKEVPAAEQKTTQAVDRQARNSVDFENA